MNYNYFINNWGGSDIVVVIRAEVGATWSSGYYVLGNGTSMYYYHYSEDISGEQLEGEELEKFEARLMLFELSK
jgi:hypothetical protein